ncbi:hypothetical protein BY996DRAFT_6459475 [Phakopsora pachyrhizi]|nr:hypothetical protein BY996DRAFT_6459475 [Phakopsora pachyrhizi]
MAYGVHGPEYQEDGGDEGAAEDRASLYELFDGLCKPDKEGKIKDKDRIRKLKGLKDKERIRTIEGLKVVAFTAYQRRTARLVWSSMTLIINYLLPHEVSSCLSSQESPTKDEKISIPKSHLSHYTTAISSPNPEHQQLNQLPHPLTGDPLTAPTSLQERSLLNLGFAGTPMEAALLMDMLILSVTNPQRVSTCIKPDWAQGPTGSVKQPLSKLFDPRSKSYSHPREQHGKQWQNHQRDMEKASLQPVMLLNPDSNTQSKAIRKHLHDHDQNANSHQNFVEGQEEELKARETRENQITSQSHSFRNSAALLWLNNKQNQIYEEYWVQLAKQHHDPSQLLGMDSTRIVAKTGVPFIENQIQTFEPIIDYPTKFSGIQHL